MMVYSSRSFPLVAAFSLLAACGPKVEDEGSSGSGSGDSGVEPDDSTFVIAVVERNALDILFVVDNSASMGEEQAVLAQTIGSTVGLLERPDIDLNYRIGITTTDNGHPWCQGTGPEAGALRLTSCRSRPDEFVFDGASTTDVTQESCFDLCPPEWTNIEIQPTRVEGEEGAAPRPWMERIDGVSNLPEGLSAEQAFMCFAPQGIDGCGFESHLESMWKALRRSEIEGDPDFGFIREDALLLIVHVTDEADCSYNNEHETIFLPDGDRVFWSDPAAATPTSAVCWNAGVACSGSGTYDDCTSVNLDANGAEVSTADADEDAVLRPVSRYIDIVQDLEDRKQQLFPEREVLVSVVGGVRSDGTISYQDAADPQYQQDFGIGPGCSSTNGDAVPPVRLAEFARAFQFRDEQNLFSVCDSDYSSALQTLLASTPEQRPPACMPTCVADADPSTPDQLDPLCTVTERVPLEGGGLEETDVPPCAGDQLPAGASVCYTALVGEQMDQYCIAAGHNLEFQLIRAQSPVPKSGTSVVAECEPSSAPEADCPDLR